MKLWLQRIMAKLLYVIGFKPTWSTGIHDKLTVGYGKLSENGFWQYPLDVDEEGEIK